MEGLTTFIAEYWMYPFWLIVIVLFLNFISFGTWVSAIAANADVSIYDLIGLRLRRMPISTIVFPFIKASRVGIVDVNLNELEAHYLAGGSPEKVVLAMIFAFRAKIPLTFQQAFTVDLSGRDILEIVKACVYPRVIQAPAFSALTKDGIELKVKLNIAVRTSVERLIGAVGEDTLVAKISEAVADVIGGFDTYNKVMENPNAVSAAVYAKNLDRGTSLDVASIDIDKIEVGRNIGGAFKVNKAEIDKLVAKQQAEARYSIIANRVQAERMLAGESQRANDNTGVGNGQSIADGGSFYSPLSNNVSGGIQEILVAETPLTVKK